jgi:hypothetical protein
MGQRKLPEERLSVTLLSVEQRHGNERRRIAIRRPSWWAIEGAIRGLDANRWSALTLQGQGETRMTIGGGAGRYLAHILTGEGRTKQLVDLARTEGTVPLLVGGYWSSFPRRLLVNLRTVLKAARHFAETGELEQSLSWEDGPERQGQAAGRPPCRWTRPEADGPSGAVNRRRVPPSS